MESRRREIVQEPYLYLRARAGRALSRASVRLAFVAALQHLAPRKRAGARLQQVAPAGDDVTESTTPDHRELLDRYVTAFENKDISAIVELFTADAVWEMPPFTGWYQGPANIGRLVATHCPGGPGDLRLVPTEANGQPAFAMYLHGDDGDYHPFQLHVLTVTSSGVAHVTAFLGVRLFAAFGLPQTQPAHPPTH